jgi:hypothetical protein
MELHNYIYIYIYISHIQGFSNFYRKSSNSIQLQRLSKLNKYRLKNNFNLLYKTVSPKYFQSHLSLITLGKTLRLISICCSPNYIQTPNFLRNADHYVPFLSKINIVPFTLFDFLLSQLVPIHTSWFSYINFNIILQILPHVSFLRHIIR